eukprot:Gb_08415 [translate_table: standard]
MTGITWTSITPFFLTSSFRSRFKACQHVLIITLKGSNARESPCTITLRVRRIPHLSCWSHTHLNFHNSVTQKSMEILLEASHKISIALYRGSSLQNGKVITSQRNILVVSPAPLVCVG